LTSDSQQRKITANTSITGREFQEKKLQSQNTHANFMLFDIDQVQKNTKKLNKYATKSKNYIKQQFMSSSIS